MFEALIQQYGAKAQTLVNENKRRAVLPCEEDLGEQCSARFLRVMKSDGAGEAVSELTMRCPKGNVHALKALGWSTLFALSPLGAYSNAYEPCGGGDPCLPGDPTAADPCGGGDPISREIANCDC